MNSDKIYFPQNMYIWNGSDNTKLYHSPDNFSTGRFNYDAYVAIELLRRTNSIKESVQEISRLYNQNIIEVEKTLNELVNYLKKIGIASEQRKFENVHEIYSPNKRTYNINTAYIHVTYICNLSCIYCYNRDVRNKSQKYQGHLSEEEWILALKRLKEINISKVILTGGELFTKKKVTYAIIEACKDLDLGVSILTNAVLLNKLDIDKLKGNVNYVQVSLDSFDKDINDLHRGKGTYKKTINAIKMLKDSGIPVSINAVVTKHNVNQIPMLTRWCYEDIKVNTIQLSYMLPMDNDSMDLLCADVNEFNNSRREALQYVPLIKRDEFKQNVRVTPRYFCGAGFGEISISPNGDLFPCQNFMEEEFKLGNVLVDDLIDMYNNNKKLAELRDASVDNIPACSKCNLRYACGGGCRANSYKYGSTKNLLNNPSKLCSIYKSAAEDLLETVCIFGEYSDENSNKTFVSMRPLI